MTRVFASFGISIFFALAVAAQTTTFTYQGSLSTNGSPANGNHDFEFALFDSLSGGAQLGSTLTRSNVTVSNGSFSVSLDFGNHFPGANRFLEFRVRPSGGGAFTPLAPRQPVNSAPYSVKSLTADVAGSASSAINATNSAQLGGVAAGQYVLTTDPRLSDSRPPTAGSGSYIQNQSIGAQTGSFNISGSAIVGGTLAGNFINAATQYNLASVKMLSGSGAFFDGDFGINVAISNTIVGEKAGISLIPDPSTTTSTGKSNTFIGGEAGSATTTGQANSFVGLHAGARNTVGSGNSFYGAIAGAQNTEGSSNSFFGRFAGFRNTTGNTNAFFGFNGGLGNTSGSNNSFFGASAGDVNTIGSNNTLIGADAETSANNLTFATAVGAGAVVMTSNTVALGRTADAVHIPGTMRIITLGAAGATTLCRNASNQVSTCSSSIRYKRDINTFASGLDLIRKLRPVSFAWRDGGMLDLGLVAEDVAKVEPLLATTNAKGEVEGVKYDRVGVVLVNAVKEQQIQIDAQQRRADEQQRLIEAQRAEIEALKNALCSVAPTVSVCRRSK